MIEHQTEGGPSRGLGWSGFLSVLLAPWIGLSIALAVCGGFSLSPRGVDETAVAAFNRCPAVTAALGSPVERSMLSLGCGTSVEGGGCWSMRIVGPRGSASASYCGIHSTRPPRIEYATAELSDGRTITAVPCESAGLVVPPRPD